MTSEQRSLRITTPKSGSKLSILQAQLKTVEELEKTGTPSRAGGYLPSRSQLETQIEEITSGAKEREIKDKINKLEEETKDYGETSWYNFTKNSKLREIKDLKFELGNLY